MASAACRVFGDTPAGRQMLTSVELSGAFSFCSPLKIEFAVEQLVPELALAVDGDPATAVPSAAPISYSLSWMCWAR